MWFSFAKASCCIGQGTRFESLTELMSGTSLVEQSSQTGPRELVSSFPQKKK